MNKGSASALAAALVLTGLATPALAELEREDVLMLDADGHRYTRYQSLRSDSGQQILDLAPGETIADALFIVPSDYQQSRRADGGTRLQFAGGNYAIMTVGNFGQRVHRTANGNYLFTSDNRIAGVGGHGGQSGAREDFASYAYSWFLPANIEILNYRASRHGQWRQQGNTLSWHGQYIKDVAFTIRYRVIHEQASEPAIAQSSESGTPAAVAPPHAEPPKAPPPAMESPKTEEPSPNLNLKTSPSATLFIEAAPKPAFPERRESGAAQQQQAPEPHIELETSPAATVVIEAPPERGIGASPTLSEGRESSTPRAVKAPAPGIALRISPPATIVIDQRTRIADTSGREQTPPRSLSLANVVTLADSGRPQVTARGKAVLGRLARTLAVNNARRIVVTGPSIADSRDIGGSVAQAARVADYLGRNGMADDRIDFKAGRMRDERDGSGVEITITPGSALGDFSAADR